MRELLTMHIISIILLLISQKYLVGEII